MPTDAFPPAAPRVTPDGTHFRLLAAGGAPVRLELYESAAATAPSRTLEATRAGDAFELFVEGVGDGQCYTWARGARTALLDPCAVTFTGRTAFGADDPAAPRPPFDRINEGARVKSLVVAPPPPVAWQRPRTAWQDSVVYELHVRGYTRSPSSGADAPGTYRALGERAAAIRELGVTAVELLPVHEFDETEVRRGAGLVNFWGYSPLGWFAPNRRYAAEAGTPLGPLHEFRAMVQAFHAAGLQVILDVVFNHTAEMGADGPTWHLRGLDDARFYLHDADGGYLDRTGCGNTVRAQAPAVRALVRDALRWWVHGLGVDGFRFDLASVLALDEAGELLDAPPLLREIEEDPMLAGTLLVAEPWDAADGYLVDRWPGGERWAVWNDRFRDDVRRAWLTDARAAGTVATRLAGSSDLFADHGPARSVNFVAAHDGFTLADTVSYAQRHNEANGEGGRDGHAAEPSSNHGTEGATGAPAIRRARERARRNLVATLLLSQGVPMLLAGDEFGRTQRGNNNAYCHDSPLTWLDWTHAESDAAFRRFVAASIALRHEHACLRRTTFLTGDSDVAWLGVEGGAVEWDDASAFGCHLAGDPGLCVLVNLGPEACRFELPAGAAWRCALDTAAQPPRDCFATDARPPAAAGPQTVAAKSLRVFTERN